MSLRHRMSLQLACVNRSDWHESGLVLEDASKTDVRVGTRSSDHAPSKIAVLTTSASTRHAALYARWASTTPSTFPTTNSAR